MELNQFITAFASQFEDGENGVIQGTTVFKQLETWDSLTAFSVQVMIEDDYNVKINPDELKSTNTVQELFELVNSKIV